MNKNSKNKKNKEKRYFRLLILDEKKFDPVISLKLTTTNVLFYFGSALLLILILAFLFWRFTPMKKLLPKYEDVYLKNKVIENRILIDSLQRELSLRDNYFNKLRFLILEKNIDSIARIDSSITNRNILTASEYDSIIAELQKGKFLPEDITLSATEKDQLNDIQFVKPVDGNISNNFNPSEGHFGIDIVAKEKSPVKAVLSGTVILATWTINTGYVIEIQHPNNMISVYKHNAELLKKEGEKVKSGEAIALLGNSGDISTGPHLHFELWYNGKPVNPADYINF